jgi:hypothetical protein
MHMVIGSVKAGARRLQPGGPASAGSRSSGAASTGAAPPGGAPRIPEPSASRVPKAPIPSAPASCAQLGRSVRRQLHRRPTTCWVGSSPSLLVVRTADRRRPLFVTASKADGAIRTGLVFGGHVPRPFLISVCTGRGVQRHPGVAASSRWKGHSRASVVQIEGGHGTRTHPCWFRWPDYPVSLQNSWDTGSARGGFAPSNPQLRLSHRLDHGFRGRARFGLLSVDNRSRGAPTGFRHPSGRRRRVFRFASRRGSAAPHRRQRLGRGSRTQGAGKAPAPGRACPLPTFDPPCV